VVKTFDERTGQWLDVKKEIKPDIVFFTNPYIITRPEYLITNYLDTLTCYVPYGFKNTYLHQFHFNQLTQNFVWKFFLETNIHQKLATKYSGNKGRNTVVTGYPGMDSLLLKDSIPKDVWKIKNRNIKRIIWAPHHTIPGNGVTLDFSTFLKYYEFMPKIAEKYKNQIQIAFKPHPMLRENLNNLEGWGKQRTDSYYKKWEELPNGQLNEFEYINLFITSDAMIHDCGSFSVEYLYTSKPVMFLVNDETITDRYNEVGKMAFSKLYHGRNTLEIETFIVDTILNANDYMREERMNFFNEVIKPPNEITASENIFNCINAEIFN
jgi:CDP-glycerol glycerophosphotransferase (TagB/SpsB family)